MYLLWGIIFIVLAYKLQLNSEYFPKLSKDKKLY